MIIVPVFKEREEQRGEGNCWIIRDEGQSETVESIGLVSSSARNRRANVSTRRMARFTLRAWLGEEKSRRHAASRGRSCQALDYRITDDSRVRVRNVPTNLLYLPIYIPELYSSIPRVVRGNWFPFLLWFQLRRREERIHPSGPRTRLRMPGISRQGSQSRAGKINFFFYAGVSFSFLAVCVHEDLLERK